MIEFITVLVWCEVAVQLYFPSINKKLSIQVQIINIVVKRSLMVFAVVKKNQI